MGSVLGLSMDPPTNDSIDMRRLLDENGVSKIDARGGPLLSNADNRSAPIGTFDGARLGSRLRIAGADIGPVELKLAFCEYIVALSRISSISSSFRSEKRE